MRTWSLRTTTDRTPAELGGRLCLAVANSVLWRRGDEPVDRVPDYPALVDYLHLAGLLDPAERADLAAAAAAHPVIARRTHTRAVALREALFRLLSAAAAGAEPDGSDVATLREVLHQGLAELRLTATGDGRLAAAWPRPTQRLDWPLWEIAGSAASLLLAEEPTWLKQCPGERCGWLFTDRSRSHSRRWCDSTMCGNRDRVRRHYQRTRA
jgi:predicted RNA-binding Zn ribbon-like protein